MPNETSTIPASLMPYFQEYDLADLHLRRDADLIIQRTLEYGNWEEIRWLFMAYHRQRISRFVRAHGERWLSAITFNYWRKLLGVRKWTSAPFEQVMQWPP